jgi:glyoxylase-like metal-dependent hydrolase (beta-lactamase superfamily II)
MNAPPTPRPLPVSVHFIERDWLSCNQVVFFDGHGDDTRATLVDSGYGKHAELTAALVRHVLRSRGVSPDALKTLINTHLHSDHCGANALLAREFGCRILVPTAEFEAVQRWDEDALTYRGTGQHCERFSAQGAIGDGDLLTLGEAQWQVHAAPGHDPHSVILHCPQHRLLLSADALWENGFGVIFPELGGDSGFAEQRAVLELIASLEVDTVIPGHGTPFGDVAAAIERARARLAALSADPARNARNAIKALTKFLLLDYEAIAFDALVESLRDATIIANAASLIGMPLPEALAWGVRELERQSQLRRDGDMLYNREPALEGTY